MRLRRKRLTCGVLLIRTQYRSDCFLTCLSLKTVGTDACLSISANNSIGSLWIKSAIAQTRVKERVAKNGAKGEIA